MIRIGKCASCGQVGVLGGRALCPDTCYKYHTNHGTLENFPRSTWKREDLIAEYNICKARGLTVRESAEKIGVSFSALRQAIRRTRKLARENPALWDQDLL